MLPAVLVLREAKCSSLPPVKHPGWVSLWAPPLSLGSVKGVTEVWSEGLQVRTSVLIRHKDVTTFVMIMPQRNTSMHVIARHCTSMLVIMHVNAR